MQRYYFVHVGIGHRESKCSGTSEGYLVLLQAQIQTPGFSQQQADLRNPDFRKASGRDC